MNNSFDHSNDNMAPEQVHPPSSMNPPPQLRPLHPHTPAITAWSPPLTLTSPIHHNPKQKQSQHQQSRQQQQKQTFVPIGDVVPFDSSATELPGLTFPENNRDRRDLYFPRDEVIVTETYVPLPPNPLRPASHDPIFFLHPTLVPNIAEFFGHSVLHTSYARRNTHSMWRPPPALPYDAELDDLTTWKERVEGGAVSDKEEMSWLEALPPWSGRFDLGFDD